MEAAVAARLRRTCAGCCSTAQQPSVDNRSPITMRFNERLVETENAGVFVFTLHAHGKRKNTINLIVNKMSTS